MKQHLQHEDCASATGHDDGDLPERRFADANVAHQQPYADSRPGEFSHPATTSAGPGQQSVEFGPWSIQRTTVGRAAGQARAATATPTASE